MMKTHFVCMACFFIFTLSSPSSFFATHALQSAPTSSSSRIIRMECSLVDPYDEQVEIINETSVASSSPAFARNMHLLKRRDAAAAVLAALTTTTTTIIASSASITSRPALAISLPFIPQKERRQLEVCLVAILRITYWAEKLALDLSSSNGTSGSSSSSSSSSSNDTIVLLTKEQVDQRQRLAYLEARLGAKAILTGKIGGGATARVYSLAALNLVDCLADIDYYYSTMPTFSSSSSSSSGGKTKTTRANTQFSDLQRDFYEALATLVEFDGYDTLTDASPRSTLLLQQYNPDKLLFVRRMLTERLVPLGNQLVNSFSPEAIALSQSYVQKYYPNEIIIIPPPTAGTATDSSKAEAEMEQRIL